MTAGTTSNRKVDREAAIYAETYAVAGYMLRDLQMPVYLRANLRQLIAGYLHCEAPAVDVARLREQVNGRHTL